MPEVMILRRDADPQDGEPLVKFRLFYEGPLYASNSRDSGATDRRAGHKHAIRRAFHRQLKHYWQVHPFLRDNVHGWMTFFPELPHEMINPHGVRKANPSDDDGPWRLPQLHETLAFAHEISGVQFVPLVCEQFKLLCELDILLLRRDKPGGIIKTRDLDNRLKTLFDALRMPSPGPEMTGAQFDDDERPCFVLLQDDRLISHVRVETDELLDPPEKGGKDDSWVRLLITVKLHPYEVNMFNLSFSGG